MRLPFGNVIFEAEKNEERKRTGFKQTVNRVGGDKEKLFNANVSEDIEWQVVMILGLMFKGQVRPEVI